ncbi:MAG TPA: ankyrin repeat domain-containing protein [Bryobacteraceae bacterium]
MLNRLYAGCSILLVLAATGSAAANDTRLVDAVSTGDKPAVRALLEQKADVNAKTPDGTSALHWAVRKNDLDTTELLLQAGADVTAQTRYGVTPLSLSATNGNGAIVEKLLKAGASANSANPSGETALMTAARTGKVDAVRVLLDYGADVNARESVREQSALMWAVLENHPDVVKAAVGLRCRHQCGYEHIRAGGRCPTAPAGTSLRRGRSPAARRPNR